MNLANYSFCKKSKYIFPKEGGGGGEDTSPACPVPAPLPFLVCELNVLNCCFVLFLLKLTLNY